MNLFIAYFILRRFKVNYIIAKQLSCRFDDDLFLESRYISFKSDTFQRRKSLPCIWIIIEYCLWLNLE